MKRTLKRDETDVVDASGDIVAKFITREDATKFVNVDRLIEVLEQCSMLVSLPYENRALKHQLSVDVRLVLAKAKGQMP